MPPNRIKRYQGRHALVDGISYVMPVSARNSPALMAGFTCDWEKANALLPGNEIHALRLPNGKATLLITVINYLDTSIGKYIEYSIAIGCTHGPKPAPRILNAMMLKTYGTGQYILDLPVSSEVSVKGGKGIWGMPKHKANLDFKVTEDRVTSQYEKDGQFAFRIEIDRPKSASLKLKIGATNYCRFRNMLMASYIYFDTKAGVNLFGKAKGKLFIGDHPNVSFLRDIDINPDPYFTLFMPKANGILDDHFDCWFMTYDEPQTEMPEGLESIYNLGLSEDWLPDPSITDFEKYKI
ncbi:acetoacetate decarboxylase family protein [Aquiflexum gelatinilyticum]|uniref:Acetoacetate decarboxylase family protein n=1 Tax=Aquiflexum gelatinilyticum TaxID=2961943 RepID=A0A9X2P8G8_9BACT|nr:acetoacetate decarboxylase family protein [Aquiflexum gelatinilyticum]MCR9015690.1 acetoacetate decarboxylase family protein [Aquiflexum gelatinilyticum]